MRGDLSVVASSFASMDFSYVLARLHNFDMQMRLNLGHSRKFASF
jgi:hypothetical protein